MKRLRSADRPTFLSSRVVRFVAGIGAITLVVGIGLAGASPASAVATFTVTGSVPVGSGGSVEVVDLVWDGTDEQWIEGTVAVVANTSSGAFSFALPAGAARYTVGFIPDHLPFQPTILGGLADPPPDDTLSPSVFFGATGSVKALGAVTLLPAGVIQGVLTSSAGGAPIAGAEVDAFDSDDDDFQDTTASDGSFYIAVNDSADNYEVASDADGFEDSFYPGTQNEAADTTVDLDAGNSYMASGINFSADPVGADILAEFATGQAEVYLYQLDGHGHVTSSIPVQADGSPDTSLEFDDVPRGSYGIAFRDTITGRWIPWTSYTGSTGVPAGTGGPSACLLDVTVTGSADIDLGSIKLGSASTSTCSSPWGTASSYSGTVLNMPTAASVSAWLYYVDGDGNLQPINRTSVAVDGSYAIDGVSAPGQYIVYFEVDTLTAPFLDTWSDGSDADDSEDAESVIADTPAISTTDTDSPGHDVNLVAAGFITGTVDSGAGPLAGADVEAVTSDGVIAADTTSGVDGSYRLRVGVHVAYDVDAFAVGYADQFWDGVADPEDATIVTGPPAGDSLSDIDFDLTSTQTSISGLVIRVDSFSGETLPDFPSLTADLYEHTGGFWKKVSSESATDIEGAFNLIDFPTGVTSLSPGSYRIRLHSPGGWVAIAEYEEASSVDDGEDIQDVLGPTCYIAISNLVAHEQREVVAAVDVEDTKTVCHGEPQAQSEVHRATAPSWVTAAVAVAPIPTPTPTPTPTSTTTSSATPTPTATPTGGSGSGFGWVLWLVGGLIAAGVIALGAIIFVRRRF